MKYKISFIISNLGQGGAERQLLELIKNIDKTKFEVYVCLYAINQGVFFKEIEEIKNISLKKNVLSNNNKILKIMEALKFIRKYLVQNNFDLVQTSLFLNGFLVRLIAPANYKNKIISTIRNSLIIYKKRHIIIEKMLCKNSFIVANTKTASEDFKLKLKKRYHHHVTFIHNGYNVNQISTEKNYNNNIVLIGNIGRITYQKNQIQILRVFNNLIAPNSYLQIIGSFGDQMNTLNEFIIKKSLGEKVQIIDKLKDIENYYKNFDIFILSSHYEGCPNVLFEAMLTKCFCIISKNANTDNFITDGENGLVYDNTDNGLEIKLKYAIEIKGTPIFKKICDNGYKYARNNFSMDKMVQAYEELYLKIISKKI